MANDYSAVTWTTASLLAEVRRKARLSDTSSDYTDAVLLREATDCLWSFAGFAMQQARDGRLNFELSRTISTWARTANSDELELPPFAVADTINHVEWIDSTGNTRKVLQQIPALNEALATQPNVTGEPFGYTLLDGRIRLVPRPSDTASTVRFSYQRRHGELVASSVVGTVLSHASLTSGTTSSITLSATPPVAFSTSTRVDIMTASHPHRVELADVSITNISTNTLTLGSTTYAALNAIAPVGLTVALSGQSPYVGIPLELRQPFTEYVSAVVLRQLGDEAGAQAYEQSAREGMARGITMLNPRSKAAREKVVNPHSLFRRGARSSWRGTGETW